MKLKNCNVSKQNKTSSSPQRFLKVITLYLKEHKRYKSTFLYINLGLITSISYIYYSSSQYPEFSIFSLKECSFVNYA